MVLRRLIFMGSWDYNKAVVEVSYHRVAYFNLLVDDSLICLKLFMTHSKVFGSICHCATDKQYYQE